MVYVKAVGWLLVFALGLWMFVGAVFGDGDSDTTARLENAACEDLDDPDVSMFQVVSSANAHHEEVGRPDPHAATAFFLDEAIREDCPQHLDQWEATLLYEDWIAD